MAYIKPALIYMYDDDTVNDVTTGHTQNYTLPSNLALFLEKTNFCVIEKPLFSLLTPNLLLF